MSWRKLSKEDVDFFQFYFILSILGQMGSYLCCLVSRLWENPVGRSSIFASLIAYNLKGEREREKMILFFSIEEIKTKQKKKI